jgi:hypothetical protein
MYSPLIDEHPGLIQDGSQELQFGLWINSIFKWPQQRNISYGMFRTKSRSSVSDPASRILDRSSSYMPVCRFFPFTKSSPFELL